jgi:hypothetical protein
VHRGWWVLTGLLLTGAACARHRAGQVNPVNHTPVRVEVKSHYGLPMEVYALGGGITHRLGIVHPEMASQFVVPENLLGNGTVILEARPTVSGPRFRSGELLLAPGAVVDLVIAAQLFNSTATIRP